MIENILKSYFNITDNDSMPPGKKKTLEAAIKLFAKQGFNGTSTLEIAKTAGISQATVFKYFKTKEDLLYSIIVPVIPKLFLNFLKRVQNTNTIEELISYVVEDRIRFLEENKDTVKIVYIELLTNETLKKQLIISIEQVFSQINFKDMILDYKKQNKELNEKLTTSEVIRSFSGPILTYSIQRFILFEDVSCENEKHDLKFIKNQIYRSLTK